MLAEQISVQQAFIIYSLGKSISLSAIVSDSEILESAEQVPVNGFSKKHL